MAGHAEVARGSDKATKIMKFDGLPGKGKPVVEELNTYKEMPVLGGFVSTMGNVGGVDMNPLLATSSFGDQPQRPKFTAKITLIDTHGNESY